MGFCENGGRRMKLSAKCICGYETPLVDYQEDIDWDLFHTHQKFCSVLKSCSLKTKMEGEE